MSNFTAPNNRQYFTQNNVSDTGGDLWASFGVDLSSVYGKIRTSKRLYPTLSEAQMDNDDVQAFCLYDGITYVFADGRRMYIGSERNPRISGNWTSSTTSVDIGQETDSVVFNNQMLVSTGQNIAMTTNGTSFDTDWGTTVDIGNGTVLSTTMTVGVPHIMDVALLGQETLFITNGNKVHYANATAGSSTVTLPTHLTACSITTDAYATWVGTYTNSGDAYIYEIYVGEVSGSTPVARRSYLIKGSSAVLSMDTTEQGVPYAVTDTGKILVFNGRAFVPVAEFPFSRDGVCLAGLSLGNIDDDNLARAIHPKGMRADGNKLLININTDNQLITDLASNPIDDDDIFENVVVNERSPSGVWEYDIDTGVLNHLAPLSNATTNNGFHRQQSSGPILVTNNQYTRFLTAGRVQSDRTDVYAENPTIDPFGYIITPEIQSQTVLDANGNFILHKDVLNSETVSIKYRTSKRANIPKYAEANWTGGTTFVVAEDISDTIETGDLVEVIDGYGAGKMAHISSIQTSSTTTTVTLDTSIGSDGETGQVRIWNFKEFNTEDFANYEKGGLSESATWFQFMIVLNGDVTIRQIYNKGNAKSER